MIRRRRGLLRGVLSARFAMVIATLGCGTGAAVARSPSPARAGETRSQATLITLERKPCFGTCPVYVVTVTGDGVVVFDGRAHVDSIRRVTSRIDTDHVAGLIRLFDESQFFTLDDRYLYGEQNCRQYAADAPIVITSITTGNRAKKVEHDAGCFSVPQRLVDLEQKIDEIVGTARWIGRR